MTSLYVGHQIEKTHPCEKLAKNPIKILCTGDYLFKIKGILTKSSLAKNKKKKVH